MNSDKSELTHKVGRGVHSSMEYEILSVTNLVPLVYISNAPHLVAVLHILFPFVGRHTPQHDCTY